MRRKVAGRKVITGIRVITGMIRITNCETNEIQERFKPTVVKKPLYQQ
jgi:hypothetical protein